MFFINYFYRNIKQIQNLQSSPQSYSSPLLFVSNMRNSWKSNWKRADRFSLIKFYLQIEMKVLIISWILSAVFVSAARKLIFIECITRHGIRYPSFPNDYDYSNITDIPNTKSQLTAGGRQMLFLLGRRLYQKYWKSLFEGTLYEHRYDRSLIEAKSTNRNRTIESLQNLLAGLLAELPPNEDIENLQSLHRPPFPGDYEQIQKEMRFKEWKKLHLVPIHVQKGAEGDPWVAYMKNEGDFLVKEQYGLCPNQKKWQQENKNSPFVKSLMRQDKIMKTVQKLRTYFPSLPMTFDHIYEYVDNYKCLKAMGQKYLQVFQDPEIKDYLEFLYIARLYVIYIYTETQIKAFSKTLLSTTISNMKRAIAAQGPKLIFYSGHDITIAFMLTALNFTNVGCLYQKYILNRTVQCYWQYPVFASSFIFELYQEENGTYSIETSINGEKYPIPICNNSNSCNLQAFQQWFESFTIKQSPNQVCGVQVQEQNLGISKLFLSFALGMAAAFLLLNFLYAKDSREDVEHQSISQDDLST